MKVKRMGITEILRRIWLFSANEIKSSESVSKQPTQLIIELNSSLRQIIVTLIFSLKFVCCDNLYLFCLQPLKQRSRRNSIDLYTADYNIKLICDKAAAENQSNMNSNSNNQNQNQNNNNQNTNQMKMIQRSSSHIRVEDMANR